MLSSIKIARLAWGKNIYVFYVMILRFLSSNFSVLPCENLSTVFDMWETILVILLKDNAKTEVTFNHTWANFK